MIHFHGKAENLMKIALGGICSNLLQIRTCLARVASLLFPVILSPSKFPHLNFFTLHLWAMQLKWQSRKKLKLLFRFSTLTCYSEFIIKNESHPCKLLPFFSQKFKKHYWIFCLDSGCHPWTSRKNSSVECWLSLWFLLQSCHKVCWLVFKGINWSFVLIKTSLV